MKLTKKQKQEVSKQMAEALKKSSYLYFAQYQGLKFVDLAQLRKKLKPLSCRCQVVKNSVASHALGGAGIAGAPKDLFKGPVAMMTGEGTDPAAAAKVLAAFAKEFPFLKIKGGFFDGEWLNPASCAALATLGTKPEMLSMLAGTLQGMMSQMAAVAQAPIRDLALILLALKDKKGSEAPAAA